MRIPLLTLLVLLVALATAANASAALTTEVENFVDVGDAEPGQPYGARALKLDTKGNAVGAHSGSILYADGRYYRYGEDYRCDFEFDSAAGLSDPNLKTKPPCGFRTYSSTDLVHWRYEGPMIKGFREQVIRGDVEYAGGIGYFGALVVHDRKRDRYVMWFNVVRPTTQLTTKNWYFTAVSRSPAGPFTDVRAADLTTDSGGDYDVFVDDDGKAYMVHVVGTPAFTLRVQRLKDDLRNGAGDERVVTTNMPDPDCLGRLGCSVGTHEAPSLFKRGSTYYLLTGEACAFCAASTGYYTASSPLGPWNGAGGSSLTAPTRKIHPASCGGQPRRVNVIPGAKGPIHLLQVDLWNSDAVNAKSGGFGYPQQGLSGYFWTQLRFNSDGSLRRLTCDRSTRLKLANGRTGADRRPRDTDVWPGLLRQRAACVATPGSPATQTLRVGRRGTLRSIALPLFRYGKADGNVEIALRRGSRTIGRWSRPAGTVKFEAQRERLATSAAVKKGDRLTLTLTHTGSAGCYGTAVSASNLITGTATTSRAGVRDLGVSTVVRPQRTGKR